MAKIVPAMQLATHAKSNTLFGGLYGVNSNFFRPWVTSILYIYGVTLRALWPPLLQYLRDIYLKEEFKASRSPPYPTTPIHLLRTTNTFSCPDNWAQARWIGSLFCKSLIHIIFLTEFSVASFLFISSNQCRRNGRQANLYVRGKVEEQSFTYPHQR